MTGAGTSPLQIWQSGVALAETVAESGRGRLWCANQARVLEGYHRIRTDPRSPLNDRAESLQRLQGLAADWEQQQRDLEALRDDLQARLAAGRLVALGFAVTSAEAQALVVVPPAAWAAGAIDWSRSTLRNGTDTYLDIRVLPDHERSIQNTAPESVTASAHSPRLPR